MENLDLNPIISAIGGALAGATSIWLAIQRIKIKERQKNVDTAAALLSMCEIYDALNELCSEVRADRGLVLFTSNGGGIPNATSIVKTSILYEVVACHDLHPIRADFQQVILDEAYTKMLREVILNSEKYGDLGDVGTGFLKHSYTSEKIEKFYIWELLRTPERYYYASLRWREGNTPPKLEDIRSSTRVCGTKISNILAKTI